MHYEKTRKRREQETEEIFEAIMTEKFLIFMSYNKSQIQEAQKTPSRINAKNKNKTNKTTKI